MHENEANANQVLVSGQAHQRESHCQPGQLKVLSQQCEKSVQKPKSGWKSAGAKEHRIKKIL